MIELSTQIPQAVSPVSGPAAPGGAAGGFLRLLATHLDAAPGTAPAPVIAALPGERQEIAADGKGLPETVVDNDKRIDPRLIWLPIDLQPQQPIAVPIAPPTAETQAASPVSPRSPSPQPVLQPFLDPVVRGEARGEQLPAKGALAGDQGAAFLAHISPERGDAAQGATKALAALLQPAADAPAARPAGQAFAAAIVAAVAGHERPARELDRFDSRSADGVAAMVQADAAARPVIHAPADAKQGALDLRDDQGLNRMIDRIEMLRDEADSRDTRIRLVPDALGSVDVSLRKEGDALHVHFTAETQATRTLLAEAQPRLTELADARGVKLGQTSVDSGTGGGAHHTHHQPRADLPSAPASAAGSAAADPTDQRLA